MATTNVETTLILRGRRKIMSQLTREDMKDVNLVRKMVNTAMTTHRQNKTEIDYLLKYAKGSQPILNKEKQIRPEINNKIVVNHASMVTRNIVGYFLGSPIQYIQAGNGSPKAEIDELNRYLEYEDKSSVDKELGDYQSITGTAYRLIYTDGMFKDEVPFENKSLNPSNTFVIYENNVAENPLAGVTYHNIYNELGMVQGRTFYVYTPYYNYKFDTDGDGAIREDSTYVQKRHNIDDVVIIEYPNNLWRMGDWEICISLMDAINAMQSGRLDDVDQTVQSLIIFMNADIDVEKYSEMREAGAVMLKNMTDKNASVDTITNALDQEGMHLYSKELEALLYAILGIPDREQRSTGGDTGQAVELRDGWADLEIIARNKEKVFKRSEKMSLKVILRILSNKLGMKLKLSDIGIKFSRNKTNNMLVKTQSYATLLSTKTLAPIDCLSIVDLVSDEAEYIARGESFWGDEFGGKVPDLSKDE